MNGETSKHNNMNTTAIITRKEKNTIVNNYILNSIDIDGFLTCDDNETHINKQKVCAVMAEFERVANYPANMHNIPNNQARFADWLMGLPSIIGIDFENYRIIEIAKEWGDLPINATEKQEDKIIGNWFNYISCKFFQLHAKLNK